MISGSPDSAKTLHKKISISCGTFNAKFGRLQTTRKHNHKMRKCSRREQRFLRSHNALLPYQLNVVYFTKSTSTQSLYFISLFSRNESSCRVQSSAILGTQIRVENLKRIQINQKNFFLAAVIILFV